MHVWLIWINEEMSGKFYGICKILYLNIQKLLMMDKYKLLYLLTEHFVTISAMSFSAQITNCFL